MNPIRIAFAGFRHGHILALLQKVQNSKEAVFVAASETDAARRKELEAAGTVRFTHDSLEAMLADVECDAIAIGDYYGRRGALAIEALQAGKHVILDKPICTRLEEWDRITDLAETKKLSLSCQLDLRSAAVFQTMRQIISRGDIGSVLTVSFSGQHPLLLGSRPSWYFEHGKQGGTINDIAIHAMDLIPWMTGEQIVEISAARVWNGKTPSVPHFQDCAQMLLRLQNDGGVLGDVSYLAPDGCGYSAPQYWRLTCHGAEGVIEGAYGQDHLSMAVHGDKEFRHIPAETYRQKDYFADFLAEIRGDADAEALTSTDVLKASQTALLTQYAADTAQHNLNLE